MYSNCLFLSLFFCVNIVVVPYNLYGKIGSTNSFHLSNIRIAAVEKKVRQICSVQSNEIRLKVQPLFKTKSCWVRKGYNRIRKENKLTFVQNANELDFHQSTRRNRMVFFCSFGFVASTHHTKSLCNHEQILSQNRLNEIAHATDTIHTTKWLTNVYWLGVSKQNLILFPL